MKQYSGLEIAIIGMAGKFPGAADVNGFWNNLKNGVESISFFTDEELLAEGEDKKLLQDPAYVRARGIVQDKDCFDAAFFNYTPDEAALMDPQMRLFHECVWSALEDAGCNPDDWGCKVGLFAGASTNVNWMVYSELVNKEGMVNPFAAAQLSNAKFLATRVSYSMNLCGPSVMVDTGCSTSLVAIQQACKSLLMAECGIAVAGGVNIRNSSKKGYVYTPGMTNSADGHCRAFDAAATGTIGGEGTAVVVLKTLKNALRDGDQIYAVIKGNGINNDGNSKVGYTAPSVDGQAEAVLMARKWAKVEPESIGFIEAHGTATALGDPIEVEALNRAFGKSSQPYCALGSVKTNIGHLDAAAGAAGLIKAALALRHRQIPASLHFTTPNPKIDFTDSPFYVNTVLKEWKNDQYPLRAGVSSFGIGGTNAHIILEEAPETPAAMSAGQLPQLLVLSARTASALKRNISNLRAHLIQNQDLEMADVAATLQTGRAAFPFRASLVCKDRQEAIEGLTALLEKKSFPAVKETGKTKTVFMFSGQGTQYSHMFRGLYEQEKIFRQAADQCFTIVQRLTGTDLLSIVFPAAEKNGRDALNRTEYAQPALFIMEYALATTLMHWHIQPDMLIGHSFGEYVAACISGVFSLEDALGLIIKRGKLMQRAAQGKMLGISIPVETLEELLAGRTDISLATVNSAELCVVAGNDEAISQWQTAMEDKGYSCKIIPGAAAYHSYLMDEILADFTTALEKISFGRQAIPVISNLTGKPCTDAEIATPAYWVNHLRYTVRFADGINYILQEPQALLLEIGPGVELASFVRAAKSRTQQHKVISLVRHANTVEDDLQHLLQGLGKIWTAGTIPAWKEMYADAQRVKISLPAYAFEKTKYPVLVDAFKMVTAIGADPKPVKDPAIASWFHTPSWKLAPLPVTAEAESEYHFPLIFTDEAGIGDALAKKFPQAIRVAAGPSFMKLSASDFRLNPASEQDFDELFRCLTDTDLLPDCIIHAWGYTENAVPEFSVSAINIFFYSLLQTIRACGKQAGNRLRKVVLVTNGVNSVLDNEQTAAVKSLATGLLKIIGGEYAVNTCAIDIEPTEQPGEKLAAAIYRELAQNQTGRVISLAHNKRWERVYESVSTTANGFSLQGRKEGVYLVTGGLGAFGTAVAGYLLKNLQAKIALVGRTILPPEQEWDASLAAIETTAAVKQKIEQLRSLQQMGEVIYLEADVANVPDMDAVVQQVQGKWGAINGVFHAAGVINAAVLAPISDLQQADIDLQFTSKLKGLQVLAQLLGEKELDFCLLLSSLSPILGGPGFGAYGPANTYMDHFVQGQRRQGRLRNWVSVNIDGFEFSKAAGLAIDKEEMFEVIGRALTALSMPQIIVSATPLADRLNKWIFRLADAAAVTVPAGPGQREGISADMQDADETLTATENELLKLWRQFFGRTDIAADDDFFERGGDSLKAITFSKRINKAFNLEMTVMEFFKRASVRKLGQYIDTLQQQGLSGKGYAAIPACELQDTYVMSSAQRRLYFLYEFDPQNLAYVMPMFFRVKGVLDKEKLSGAFNKLIARHESLRTAFVMAAAGPVQKIINTAGFGIQFFTAEEKELPAIIQAFVQPFDLAVAPLIKVGLVETGEAASVLMLSMHHIITDGVSGGVLLQDFLQLYQEAALPGLPLQYKDYSTWQQSDLHQQEIEGQRRFWLNELAGIEGPLNIPMDYKRPAVKSFEGSALSFRIGEAETAALAAIAREQGASMYMLLLSIFNILLFRISHQEDILVGTVTSGRNHADIEKILGMFVNTLMLRNQVKEDATFKEFLGAVRQKVLAALDNQGYQYEDLLTDLKLERDPGRNPLFDVMFSYDSFNDHAALALPGVEMAPYKTVDLFAKFDLTLTIHDKEKYIDLRFEYATSLFKEESIERFAGYFSHIVSSVVQDSGKKIADIDILSSEYKQLLLKGFNNTATDFATEKLLHQLFEERTILSPRNTAIIANGTSYSYEWLNENANRLAHFLRSQGVKRESAVVVIMERRVELVIALMAILKAGGKYVPVEPYVPDNRVIEIGKSVEAGFFMTNRSNADRVLATGHALPVMPLLLGLDMNEGNLPELCELAASGAKPLSLLAYPVANPEKWNLSEDLAYVIFTSGSTGKPKGVAVQHRPVINLIEWVNKTYQVNEQDKLLFVSSVSFDLSVYDIFGLFAAGGALRIASRQDLEEPDVLADIIVEEGISFWDSAPAMLQQVIPFFAKRQAEIATGSRLRLCFLSGDWIPLNMPVQMKALFGPMQFIALGGATEATVWSNYFEVESVDPAWNSIPYGKPIQNAKYLVLDASRNLCPIGVPGDLYIGGQCLALGYFNDRELSDRKFIDSPFDAGEKLYDTGDMARWFADGNIEFLGRKDSQVKVRGYRIELGEIESSLLKFEGVQQVLAQVIEKSRYDKSICAYYVAAEKIAEDQLKDFLATELPPYMLPKYFIHLNEIPVTVNGKVDRKRLPVPKPAAATRGIKTSGTPTEIRLIHIWATLLHVDEQEIGPEDDFFELGGHSILAVHLMNSIQQAFSVSVKLRKIFDNPSVRKLALLVDAMASETVDGFPVAEKKEYYVCSQAQERLFYEQWLNKNSLAYNVFGFFEVIGDPDADKVRSCFQLLVDRHESLRTSFHLMNGKIFQQVHSHALVRFVAPEDMRYAGIREAARQFIRPFDPGDASLFRCGLLKAEGNRTYLLIDIHHIVCDGVSLNILVNEFRKLYQDELLEPLTLRYVDYAEWQSRQGGTLEKQKAFWEKQLSGGWPVLNLQVNQARSKADIYPAAVVNLEISGPDYQKAKQLMNGYNVSGFMFFLSVYYILLARMSGNEDIIVATDTVGRTHPALKDIVGTFINILPLKIGVQEEDAYPDFLYRVRQSVLDAFDNQDYPFDEMLTMVRSTFNIEKPAIEVHFAFAGYMDKDAGFNNLSFVPVKIKGTETTQYEFKVEVLEKNGKFMLSFIYSKALYTEEIITLFARYYQNMLETILHNSTTLIGDIQLESAVSSL